MPVIVFLASLIVFIDSLSYSIYEIKNNNNILAGVIIIVISSISLILPTVMVIIR